MEVLLIFHRVFGSTAVSLAIASQIKFRDLVMQPGRWFRLDNIQAKPTAASVGERRKSNPICPNFRISSFAVAWRCSTINWKRNRRDSEVASGLTGKVEIPSIFTEKISSDWTF
jgi:hypothetical protein